MSIKGRLLQKKTAVYEMLLRHPFLDVLQHAVRMRKDADVCRRLAGRDGLVLKCDSYGEANRNKCLYYIYFGGAEHGFFAQFRNLLKYLAYADRFGFYPVVEWSREIPYAEKELMQGTMNPFEYYFRQPSDISLEEMRKSYNVFRAEEIHIRDFFLNQEIPEGEKGYQMSETFLERMAQIADKYIQLNAQTEEYIKEQIDSLLQGRKTLGVHVRGSDYRGGYNNHPVIVLTEEYAQATESLLQTGSYEQIFLATDDLSALRMFQKRFGEKLVYYKDVMRTKDSVSVAFSQSERPHHCYLLGLEVLRDMLSLTACDGLVAGISQVSICTQIMKRSRQETYADKVILDKGINHSNCNFVR